MARYYFHIRDERVFIPDDEGLDLLDMHAARIEARLSARDLGMAEIGKSCLGDRRAIEISDRSGKVLETVAIRTFLN